MKTKKIFVILIAVTLTVILCLTAYAVLDVGESKVENDVADVTELNNKKVVGEVLDDVPKSREITVDGKEISVIYEKTQTIGGIRRDVYFDSEGNRYHFTSDGVLSAKYEEHDNIAEKGTEKNTSNLTESDYLKIAEDHMRSVFGSDVDEYKYSNHLFQESSGKYTVYFARKIGKDGFVTAGTCIVTVLSDGSVSACSRSTKNYLEGFDVALLNEITREDVMSFAEAEAKHIFGDYGILELEISSDATLSHNGEKYVLKVSCNLVTDKPIPSELIELYDIAVALSADENRNGVSFEYELGA